MPQAIGSAVGRRLNVELPAPRAYRCEVFWIPLIRDDYRVFERQCRCFSHAIFA